MSKSVCVVYPVKNQQSNLEQQVSLLVYVLNNTSGQFEIVIVDDRSSDDTPRIGKELADEYSKVKFVQHEQTRGFDAAVKSGLLASSGILVFIKDKELTLSNFEGDLTKISKLENEDVLIKTLTKFGLTFKEYRLYRRQSEKRLLYDEPHKKIPKSHFEKFVKKISKPDSSKS